MQKQKKYLLIKQDGCMCIQVGTTFFLFVFLKLPSPRHPCYSFFISRTELCFL